MTSKVAIAAAGLLTSIELDGHRRAGRGQSVFLQDPESLFLVESLGAGRPRIFTTNLMKREKEVCPRWNAVPAGTRKRGLSPLEPTETMSSVPLE